MTSALRRRLCVSAAGGCAAAFVQAFFGIGARGLQRGREAEENAGAYADGKGEEEDRSADVNVMRAREVCGQEQDQRPDAYDGEHEAERAAEAGDEQTFREQLPDDA